MQRGEPSVTIGRGADSDLEMSLRLRELILGFHVTSEKTKIKNFKFLGKSHF